MGVRTFDKLVQHRELPAGVRIGRRLFWSTTVLEQWRADRFRQQMSWQPKRTK
jgi:predicted DNA-binding transcriptional regulator AlpA